MLQRYSTCREIKSLFKKFGWFRWFSAVVIGDHGKTPMDVSSIAKPTTPKKWKERNKPTERDRRVLVQNIPCHHKNLANH
jgi:hypothetical protein